MLVISRACDPFPIRMRGDNTTHSCEIQDIEPKPKPKIDDQQTKDV